MRSSLDGGIAQLGERLHGMQEVSGSIPLTSTKDADRLVPVVMVATGGDGLNHQQTICFDGVPFV